MGYLCGGFIYIMARRIITGQLTYSSTANRDAALTRITTALAPYTYEAILTSQLGGITTVGNAVSISIVLDDRDTAFDAAKAIYDAAVTTTRHTAGYLSVNRV